MHEQSDFATVLPHQHFAPYGITYVELHTIIMQMHLILASHPFTNCKNCCFYTTIRTCFVLFQLHNRKNGDFYHLSSITGAYKTKKINNSYDKTSQLYPCMISRAYNVLGKVSNCRVGYESEPVRYFNTFALHVNIDYHKSTPLCHPHGSNSVKKRFGVFAC